MSEAPRRRLRRIIWIGLGALALLALAAALALPTILEAALTRAVDELAGRQGVDVRWAEADIRTDGLTLTDVRLSSAEGRARVAKVRAEVDLWSAVTGDVRVRAVELIEPEVHVDLLDGMASDDSGMAPDGSDMAPDDSNMASDDSKMASMAFDDAFEMPSAVTRAFARLDGPLPAVRIERPSLVVRWGDASYRAAAEAVDLTPLDGWQVAVRDAEVHVAGERLAFARIDGLLHSATLQFAAIPAPGTRLTVGPAAVAFEQVVVDLWPHIPTTPPTQHLRARIDGVDLLAGPVLAEQLRLTASWRSRLELTVEGGRVRLSAWPDTVADHAEAPRPAEPGNGGIASRLERLAWSLPPTRVETLAVEVPGLPPLLSVEGRWHAGQLDGRAVLAGGSVTVAADIDPGRRRPHSLHVAFDSVGLAPLFARRLPPEPPRRPRRRTRADGVLSGHLTATVIDALGGQALGDTARTLVEGHLAWREGRIELAGLADAPVDGIDLGLSGAFDWQPGDDRLTFSGRAAQGPLALLGEGSIDDARGDPHVKLQARGEPIDCAAAFAAIPRGLWGPYDRARLQGELAPTFRLDWPVHRPQLLELKIRKLFKACEVTTLDARSAPPATVEGRPAPALDDVGWLDARFVLPVREGVSEGAEVNVGPGVPGYVPLAQLPRYVGATMYQSEEMNFWRNNAIDRGLLVRALRIDLTAGRFVYGGSTVTQQLVKNLFLTRKKTLARKLQELLVATRITQAISRERVLELYLNCIEFGPDLYGIGPAARYYFQKDARQLSPREAVFLAMLKPAPRRGAYYRRRGHPPIGGWWAQRAEELMRRLVENGQISAALAEAERPYHIEWVDKRYVPLDRRRIVEGAPEPPGLDDPDSQDKQDGPTPAEPTPPPFGGSRMPIQD